MPWSLVLSRFVVATLLVLGLAGGARPARAQQASPPPAAVLDSALLRDLLRLAAEDQAGRSGLAAAAARQDTAFLQRFVVADSLRSEWLEALVGERGWPTPAQVGPAGVRAAWTLLQHSPDAAFQARMLPEVERAAARGELPRADVAMLTDRVLVKSGRPQRYGTSFSVKDGRLVADPTEDLPGLAARRAAMGMPEMAAYARKLGELYGLPVDWPPR